MVSLLWGEALVVPYSADVVVSADEDYVSCTVTVTATLSNQDGCPDVSATYTESASGGSDTVELCSNPEVVVRAKEAIKQKIALPESCIPLIEYSSSCACVA